MSSQGDNGIGQNAVVCYFPDLPYYLRYQIGVDIIVKPADAQADPRAAGEAHRVIHVELFFPDGFMSNPATFARDQNFNPPMDVDHPHPVEIEGPMLSPEHQYSRVFARVSNAQLMESIMSIDEIFYSLFPQCDRCVELHREAVRRRNQPPQDFPRNMPTQNPHNQPASGIADQRDMSHAAPIAPHIFPSGPAVYPPMYPDSQINPHIPMVIEEHEIREGRRRTRALEIVGNHQPEEIILNEEPARFIIPQLNMRGEVLRQPMDINNNPQQGMPSQQRRRRPRQSRQHPSNSGITGTGHRGHMQNEDVTSTTNEPTDDGIIQLMNILDVDNEENE